ncbi:MAG: hydroxymethylglutaryl-CoA lyase [Ktedonobacteraceae bacterium]
MLAPQTVEVVEVGPRDGLQNEVVMVPTEGKLALLKGLTEAGIKRFEATSFVSPKWIPQLADAAEVVSKLPATLGVTYGALVPNERGYERAKAAGLREVVLVISATEGHSRANLNRSVDEALAAIPVLFQRGLTDNIHVRVSISTVFGCPFDGVTDIERVLWVVQNVAAAGIDEVTLCDTIGVAHPRQVFETFTQVRQAHSSLKIGAHFHDTRGLALANVIAALDAGIRTFDASIGGLGGCPFAPGAAGNAATEDLVYMLHEMGIETGINLDKLLNTADLVGRLVKHSVHARINRSLAHWQPVVPGPLQT